MLMEGNYTGIYTALNDVQRGYKTYITVSSSALFHFVVEYIIKQKKFDVRMSQVYIVP